jgi:UDP-2,3-diacylglucosamine pyrophosphatase LpxH
VTEPAYKPTSEIPQMQELWQTHNSQSGYLETDEDRFVTGVLDKVVEPDFRDCFKEPVDTFDTIILSDLHLGYRFTRAVELLVLLKSVRFKRLIINGDVFDDINMKRLNRHHWKILSTLRKLTDHESGIEVIWIRGNHDGYSDLISQLLGIRFLEEYTFNWNQKKVLVIHGDVFDSYVSRFKMVGAVATAIYQACLLLDPDNRRVGKWLKRNSKSFIRNTQRVKEAALTYARRKGADIAICGHTHHAEETEYKDMLYMNTGSWMDAPAHFVGITEDEIRLVPFI